MRKLLRFGLRGLAVLLAIVIAAGLASFTDVDSRPQPIPTLPAGAVAEIVVEPKVVSEKEYFVLSMLASLLVTDVSPDRMVQLPSVDVEI